MAGKKPHTIDMDQIFGLTRPQDRFRLLGATPEDTFDRVKAHSTPGCCPHHDGNRRQKRINADG